MVMVMVNLMVFLFGLLICAFLGLLFASLAIDLSMLRSTKAYVRRKICSTVPEKSVEHLLWLAENRPDGFFAEYREALLDKDEKYRLEESDVQLARSFSGRCKLVFEPSFLLLCVFSIFLIVVDYFFARYLVGQSISLPWIVTADILAAVATFVWGTWLISR